jgi:hypothetical protein
LEGGKTWNGGPVATAALQDGGERRATYSIYTHSAYRWMDNIKMDLREIGWDGVDWMHMAQDRDQWRALVNTVLNFRVP